MSTTSRSPSIGKGAAVAVCAPTHLSPDFAPLPALMSTVDSAK